MQRSEDVATIQRSALLLACAVAQVLREMLHKGKITCDALRPVITGSWTYEGFECQMNLALESRASDEDQDMAGVKDALRAAGVVSCGCVCVCVCARCLRVMHPVRACLPGATVR